MNDKPRKKWYEIINDHYWKALYATMTYNIILAIIDLFYPLSMVMMLTPVPIYLFLPKYTVKPLALAMGI